MDAYPFEEWEKVLRFVEEKVKELRDGFSHWTDLTEDIIEEYVRVYPPEERKNARERINYKIEQAKRYHKH